MNEQTLTPGKNRVTFESEGKTIVGTLFLPAGYQAGERPPVVIVDGPWTQVKEQVGYRYSEALAKRGFAALAFDHRYYGESGGDPRQLESSKAKIKDIQNAITFLSSPDGLNSDQIGLLGVCAAAGNMAFVASRNERIGAFATIASWLQHPETTLMVYGGEEGVQDRINKAERALKEYRQSGEMQYVKAYDASEDSDAAMFFPLDYYGNPERGAIDEWENCFAVAGWKEWLELNAINPAADITVPTLMVHSNDSALPDNVRRFYEQLQGAKDLYWTEGEHTLFYDDEDHVNEAADKVAGHFKGHLN